MARTLHGSAAWSISSHPSLVARQTACTVLTTSICAWTSVVSGQAVVNVSEQHRAVPIRAYSHHTQARCRTPTHSTQRRDSLHRRFHSIRCTVNLHPYSAYSPTQPRHLQHSKSASAAAASPQHTRSPTEPLGTEQGPQFDDEADKSYSKSSSSKSEHTPVVSFSDSGKTKVVVLGTGWASYSFVRALDRHKFDVSVISPRNHFLMTPRTCLLTLNDVLGRRSDHRLTCATSFNLPSFAYI